MNKHQEIAAKIKAAAVMRGWKVNVSGDVLRITKTFKKNNRDEFVQADSEYYSILSLLPTKRPGSTWGTDGGGIGAFSALESGFFVMNKSGGSKMVLRELSKIL